MTYNFQGSMPANIRNSKILLTGASGGIGRAIAHTLHARGAILTLTGRRVEVLDQLQAELGDRVEVLPADLSDSNEVERLAAHEQFDVVVANAGLPASGRWDSFSPEEIDRALDVNLRAPIQLARATAPAMVERGYGQIILISSTAGKVSGTASSIYSATKFGLRGFGFGMNADLRGTGVGATTVFPGFISDAGLYYDSGMQLPKGVGTRTPGQVANAVAAGITKGPAEIDVAPMLLRVGSWLFGIAPSLTTAIQRGLGGDRLAAEVAEGQRSKRN